MRETSKISLTNSDVARINFMKPSLRYQVTYLSNFDSFIYFYNKIIDVSQRSSVSSIESKGSLSFLSFLFDLCSRDFVKRFGKIIRCISVGFVLFFSWKFGARFRFSLYRLHPRGIATPRGAGVARESNEFEPSIICAALEGKPSPERAQPRRTTRWESPGLFRSSACTRSRARAYEYTRAYEQKSRTDATCTRNDRPRADAVTVKLTNFSRWTH